MAEPHPNRLAYPATKTNGSGKRRASRPNGAFSNSGVALPNRHQSPHQGMPLPHATAAVGGKWALLQGEAGKR
jgi:hypothetical protein